MLPDIYIYTLCNISLFTPYVPIQDGCLFNDMHQSNTETYVPDLSGLEVNTFPEYIWSQSEALRTDHGKCGF